MDAGMKKRIVILVMAGVMVMGLAVDAEAQRPRRIGDALRMDAAWFGTEEAREIADSVMQYQSPEGGWPKSTNIVVAPETPDDVPPSGGGRANSLDNGAWQAISFMARVAESTGRRSTWRRSTGGWTGCSRRSMRTGGGRSFIRDRTATIRGSRITTGR